MDWIHSKVKIKFGWRISNETELHCTTLSKKRSTNTWMEKQESIPMKSTTTTTATTDDDDDDSISNHPKPISSPDKNSADLIHQDIDIEMGKEVGPIQTSIHLQ